jgi:hypothetical protein
MDHFDTKTNKTSKSKSKHLSMSEKAKLL